MKPPTKRPHLTLLSTSARIPWLVVFMAAFALALVACGRPSETEPAKVAVIDNSAPSAPDEIAEAVDESPEAVLKKLQRGGYKLDNYRVGIEIMVLYHDGGTKEVDGSAWFNRRARVSQSSGGRTYGDPLMAKLMSREDPWQEFSPRAVVYRQLGQWTTLLTVIGYLYRADEFAMVDDLPTEGLFHYRARFDERPGLGASLTGWYYPGWDQSPALGHVRDLPECALTGRCVDRPGQRGDSPRGTGYAGHEVSDGHGGAE